MKANRIPSDTRIGDLEPREQRRLQFAEAMEWWIRGQIHETMRRYVEIPVDLRIAMELINLIENEEAYAKHVESDSDLCACLRAEAG